MKIQQEKVNKIVEIILFSCTLASSHMVFNNGDDLLLKKLKQMTAGKNELRMMCGLVGRKDLSELIVVGGSRCRD